MWIRYVALFDQQPRFQNYHNPDLLILDEPTSGLDPAQRIELRQLLHSLAEGDRTIILSTHVLSEVEAICERVIIISQGEIVAQDSISKLRYNTDLLNKTQKFFLKYYDDILKKIPPPL